ncbi:hypothetical protein AB0C34_26510 [Nocardia sp. NPDC049220]|uniref:hypothetical protein n=1 Tax=Nocardia sp. NPDC049220 TaxID=3155273 RepID=UPI0033FC10BE
MTAYRMRLLNTLVLTLGLPSVFLGGTSPTVSADSGVTETARDYGDGCVLYSDDKTATIDSLRLHCSAEQQDAIFHDAPLGAVPMGTTDGWVTRPPVMQTIAPALWIGKTFYTGPEGGYLLNKLTGAGIESWPADVYAGPALTDGQPTWVLDYTPSPTPQVYDEIREVAPGVWFGYSWWRGEFQTTLLLTFALA